MLKYLSLLSGEVNHSLDYITTTWASIVTHVQKPTYIHQKCLYFVFESHSRRKKWNNYDVSAKNYFSWFLFIPLFRFGGPALFNDLMQFSCSTFHFQTSLPKVLFSNDIVHSNRVTATSSGERYSEYIEQVTSEKKYVLLRHYVYIM